MPESYQLIASLKPSSILSSKHTKSRIGGVSHKHIMQIVLGSRETTCAGKPGNNQRRCVDGSITTVPAE